MTTETKVVFVTGLAPDSCRAQFANWLTTLAVTSMIYFLSSNWPQFCSEAAFAHLFAIKCM